MSTKIDRKALNKAIEDTLDINTRGLFDWEPDNEMGISSVTINAIETLVEASPTLLSLAERGVCPSCHTQKLQSAYPDAIARDLRQDCTDTYHAQRQELGLDTVEEKTL